MLVNFCLGFLGVVLFLFVFWKRLKEDYSSTIIFQTAFSILSGLALGYLASRLILPAWFFWMSFLGSVAGMFLAIVKFKLKFYETLESLILSAMPFVSLMFFRDSIRYSSLNSFLAFVTSLVLIFFAYWFDLNYKSFTWYKSGKIGFAGLFIAAIFFFVRTLIAIGQISVVSFVSKFEVYLSAVLTLVFIALLINLAREKD